MRLAAEADGTAETGIDWSNVASRPRRRAANASRYRSET
jgi:hypothetical protein